jgi:putative transposase
VPGLVVTLEAPSATSVGLCLAHMAADKRAWLERLGVEATWPMSGKPRELHVDNGAEFHSEALQRGCEEHGIELSYRPLGEPHYGGVIERVIGTMMQMVHELPGTTFSNPGQRGAYDSEKTAALTLGELQAWLALAVASYHGEIHEGLGRTPGGVWAEKATESGPPPVVASETAFLVDFLPVLRRKLHRPGFVLDHVWYYSDALKPFIARRGEWGKFVLRRDPRDVSRVWVLDPDSNAYLRVGYRMIQRPAISLWEQKAAIARLREQGRSEIDEQALFAMASQMREISESAAKTTRKARRAGERRPAASPESQAARPPPAPAPGEDGSNEAVPAVPFAEVEEW